MAASMRQEKLAFAGLQAPQRRIGAALRQKLIVGAASIVQHQNRWDFQNSACQGQSLALPARELLTTFAQPGDETQGQFFNKFRCLGGPGAAAAIASSLTAAHMAVGVQAHIVWQVLRQLAPLHFVQILKQRLASPDQDVEQTQRQQLLPSVGDAD